MKKVDGVAASCGNAIYVEMTDSEAEDLANGLVDNPLQEALEKDVQAVRQGLDAQQVIIKIIKGEAPPAKKDEDDEVDLETKRDIAPRGRQSFTARKK